MVVNESGIRVKAYPVCFEFRSRGEVQKDFILVKIRDRSANGSPRAFQVLASAVSESSTFKIDATGVAAAAYADDTELQAWIPVTCTAPEPGSESVARVRIQVTSGEKSANGRTTSLVDTEAELLYASTGHILPLWQVLKEEYLELDAGDAGWRRAIAEALPPQATAAPGSDTAGEGDGDLSHAAPRDAARLQKLFEIMHRRGRGMAALCLSGGGIRSATFNLGVLQGLARSGLLPRFDYLSSVSGGGYIASWLSAWIHRAGIATVVEKLSQEQQNPLAPEPTEIRHLRQYSNYLTPRNGFLSADTWTVAAIFVRNLALNQLILLPILAAALAVPLLAASTAPPWPSPPPVWLYVLSLVLGFGAFYEMNALRFRERHGRERSFLARGLGPLLGSAGLMAMAVSYAVAGAGWSPGWLEAWAWSAIFAIAMPVAAFTLAGVVAGQDRTLWVDVGAATAAGFAVSVIFTVLLVFAVPTVSGNAAFYAWLSPVLILLPVLIGKTLFTGFDSLAESAGRSSEKGDAEREWWARWSAWVLISLLGWLVVSGIVLYGPALLKQASARVTGYLAGGGLGLLTSLLGKAAATPAKDGQRSRTATWSTWALGLVAPLFCVVLAVLVSDATQHLVWFVQSGFEWVQVGELNATRLELAPLLAVAVGLGVLGFLMGLVVNANRFSLQAMYRNRLVRAYLGASRTKRRASRFTGFDTKDNLRLCMLRKNRPLPVVNMALNLVDGADLAWQERKASNFTATPLHCGSVAIQPGYRRTPAYGGTHGISLATAMATSGAAANPNMGHSSSPVVAFIMTLFNARLGIWLGNPGAAGSRRKWGMPTFMKSGPRNAARSIFAEALGHTDDKHPYVNLSDGGHFDNLGLYEMVLRRCRWIVVCDSGCDPAGEYSDLGNAIRKIRVDFGIPIEFANAIDIASADQPRAGASRCAVAEIKYTEVDGSHAKNGTLIYIKPTICGDEPYDVFNYVRSNAKFPHETTADQWFSESQFESYRTLGAHSITTIVGKQPLPDVEALAERLSAVLAKPRPRTAATIEDIEVLHRRTIVLDSAPDTSADRDRPRQDEGGQ